MFDRARRAFVTFAVGMAAVTVQVGAAPEIALAQMGRYCERRTTDCWDCADITFPAEIPCVVDACAPGDLCVIEDGTETCFGPSRVCCPAGESCDPPSQSFPCDPCCRPDCTFCGDGVVNGIETCDPPGSDPPPPGGGACRALSCTYCGDGIRNGFEECDGSAAGCTVGDTCTSACTCVVG